MNKGAKVDSSLPSRSVNRGIMAIRTSSRHLFSILCASVLDCLFFVFCISSYFSQMGKDPLFFSHCCYIHHQYLLGSFFFTQRHQAELPPPPLLCPSADELLAITLRLDKHIKGVVRSVCMQK